MYELCPVVIAWRPIQLTLQIGDLDFRATIPKPVLPHHRPPSEIVAAIFEAMQSLDETLGAVLHSSVVDDSTRVILSFVPCDLLFSKSCVTPIVMTRFVE